VQRSGVRGTKLLLSGVGRWNVREVVTAKVGDRELAEDIVEDRGCVPDRVVALNEARRLEAREGERVDVFLERHAILQADRDRDREIVHEASEGGALLVHVDEDLAEPAVRILAGPEIDLVAADPRLLGVALSSSGKAFPHDETLDARDGRFVGGNCVRLARLFDRFHCRLHEVTRVGRIGSEAAQASAERTQGRGLPVGEMRAQSAIAGALDVRLRLIRDVRDERRRLPGASPILKPTRS